mmetsp:Transcript_15852/g.40200  ORF Transcript_15852/g.40200 Transcript_15852/m.40200 type:complete len:281 (+) Transcript_15852:450-1292(+)
MKTRTQWDRRAGCASSKGKVSGLRPIQGARRSLSVYFGPALARMNARIAGTRRVSSKERDKKALTRTKIMKVDACWGRLLPRASRMAGPGDSAKRCSCAKTAPERAWMKKIWMSWKTASLPKSAAWSAASDMCPSSFENWMRMMGRRATRTMRRMGESWARTSLSHGLASAASPSAGHASLIVSTLESPPTKATGAVQKRQRSRVRMVETVVPACTRAWGSPTLPQKTCLGRGAVRVESLNGCPWWMALSARVEETRLPNVTNAAERTTGPAGLGSRSLW